jgi:hypothetical protein
MARAITAVSGRVFTIATPRTSLGINSTQRLPSIAKRRYYAAIGGDQRPSLRCSMCVLSLRHARTLLIRLRKPASTADVFLPHQIRCFANQTDRRKQSETFREYRILQEIEQRRRTLRELEDEILRSQIEVSDIRLLLNLKELDSLPV